MEILASYEDLAEKIEKQEKLLLFFTADWCPDCVFIKPIMPEIETQFPDFQFIQIDRDRFIDLCEKWSIMGIPSFVAIESEKEIGRFVNKNRKTKAEVVDFMDSLTIKKGDDRNV